ncbi:PQQ-dependent sugar dehydrogenase [Sphingorhabdus sp. 109]|jgi:glucose/arabinose dehydrogenase|uniref:PQQ-dependent sugar dehydrogenase n=1 Tax=Sphingorhabdus sp. 109 TaxID=2653173 RepID=UPI0012F32F4A|nr:PQQ-dependent sugar dehydrogenase [Sphingorhabdus sp. 109]VWX59885.1 Aldose sugar dehydrogenase YliI [Sphingorhabdus sp. 109]
MKNIGLSLSIAIFMVSCTNGENAQTNAGASTETQALAEISPVDRKPFETTAIASFDEPWAMTFLPDGRMLISEKAGKLQLVDAKGQKTEISGVPKVAYGGQGGFGDIVLAPDYATSNMVYLSWVEEGEDDTRGAVVGRAKLVLSGQKPALRNLQTIWTQTPKVTGKGHYSHRIAFSPDGKYLFIGSGDRQKFDPAQDMKANLGKIVRLYPDGSIPKDNPFVDQEDALPEIWSLGHRNILGLAFDSEGRLWNQEMGPKDGDELNLVQRAANYGYPVVSEGDHYDGEIIPNHDTHPEFEAPKVAWVPTIAPSGLIFYSGDLFPAWKGSAFLGGLASQALIRVSFEGDSAKEAERFLMDSRIREVEQGPDGALYVLEDGENGRLLKLTPTK